MLPGTLPAEQGAGAAGISQARLRFRLRHRGPGQHGAHAGCGNHVPVDPARRRGQPGAGGALAALLPRSGVHKSWCLRFWMVLYRRPKAQAPAFCDCGATSWRRARPARFSAAFSSLRMLRPRRPRDAMWASSPTPMNGRAMKVMDGRGCHGTDHNDHDADEGQSHAAKNGVFIGGRSGFPEVIKHSLSLAAEGPRARAGAAGSGGFREAATTLAAEGPEHRPGCTSADLAARCMVTGGIFGQGQQSVPEPVAVGAQV